MSDTITCKELNLKFTKEVDRLDFTVHTKDGKGHPCVIDGFVARTFGDSRYFVNAEVLMMDFPAEKDDRFGAREIPFNTWIQTEGHFTMRGAVKNHLKDVWGISIADEVKIPVAPTLVRKEIEKKIVALVMGERFNGTKELHKKVAKEFAKEAVANGWCFSDKGTLTTSIALFNFDCNGVMERWDAAYGVHEVEAVEVDETEEEVA